MELSIEQQRALARARARKRIGGQNPAPRPYGGAGDDFARMAAGMSPQQRREAQMKDNVFGQYLRDQAAQPRAGETPEQRDQRLYGGSGVVRMTGNGRGYIAKPGGEPPTSGEGFVHGLTDPLLAAAQMAAHATPDFVADAGYAATKAIDGALGRETGPRNTATDIDHRIAAREQEYQRRRGADAGMDWPRLGGNIAGALPLAVAAPATVPGAVGAGMAAGGLQPVTDPEANFWSEKANQATWGAGGAFAGNVGGRALSRAISPNTSPAVKAMTDRGVTPTPGQALGETAKRIEEKMTSVPVLGDAIKGAQRRTIHEFNTAVYDDILRPIGATAPKGVGREAVAEVGDTIGKGYDELLPMVGFRVDRQLADEVNNLRTLVAELPEREARAFERFISDRLPKALGPNGTADGQTFKEIESAIAKEAASFSKSADAYQKKLGDAFGELLTSMRDGLARSNAGTTVTVGGKSIDAGQRLKDLNMAWAKLVRLERAAASTGAAEGIFTPAQLSAAVKGADGSARRRAFARGQALMQDISDPAKEVIGNTYPDSGTAGRLTQALLAGGGGGLAVTHPLTAAGVAAGSMLPVLPYTGVGQRLTAALLTKRPDLAPHVANAVRQALPPFQVGTAAALAQERTKGNN